MKDPAFLFYPKDFSGGTDGWSILHKGAYLELLILQFNKQGPFSKMEAMRVLSSIAIDCPEITSVKDVFDFVIQKFHVTDDGLFVNKRLEFEIHKRKAYSASRRKNRSGNSLEINENTTYDNTYDNTYDATHDESYDMTHEKHMSPHMGNVNINNIGNNNYNLDIQEKNLLVTGGGKKSKDSQLTNTAVEYIAEVSRIFNKKFKVTNAVKTSLNARLKEGWKLSEIIVAAKNAQHKWRNEDNKAWLDSLFVLQPSKIEKYFNMGPHKHMESVPGPGTSGDERRQIGWLHFWDDLSETKKSRPSIPVFEDGGPIPSSIRLLETVTVEELKGLFSKYGKCSLNEFLERCPE